jgi:hypothetical protein
VYCGGSAQKLKEGSIMKQLWKTIVILSLLASVSVYSCEWKNKSKAQKTMVQITTEQSQTYATSWSDARNSPLLQFSSNKKEVTSADNNVADNTK